MCARARSPLGQFKEKFLINRAPLQLSEPDEVQRALWEMWPGSI